MNTEYYYSQLQDLVKLQEQAADKKESFAQHILIAASSILAIIVALHPIDESLHLYIRLVFVLAVVLFALGILLICITTYDYSRYKEEAFVKFHQEIQSAQKAGRMVGPVFGDKKKRTLFCEKCSFELLIIGLFLLVVYTILVALF